MTTPNPLPFAIGSTVWPGISKLVEECGEVMQVAGKLLQCGEAVQHWDGSNLRERLADELADLDAAIRFVVRMNGLDQQQVDDGAHNRRQLLKRWQSAEGGAAFEPSSPMWPGLLDLIRGCGRVLDVCGSMHAAKLEQFDVVDRDCMLLELQHVTSSIRFVLEKNGLSVAQHEARQARKLKRFCEWHESGDTAPVQPGAAGSSGR